MSPGRSAVVLLAAPAALVALAACNATLAVLESNPSGGGADAAMDGSDGSFPDEASAGDGGSNDAADASDRWPQPPGTVVTIAAGLGGAVDLDVDNAFVYVAVGGQDGGVYRVPKRGGAPDPIAIHQADPNAMRSTPSGIVWTLSPGVDPLAPSVMTLPRDGGAPVPLLVGGYNAGSLAADGDRVAWVDHAGGQGRVMVAELDKGSTRPIVENQLGVGGFAIEGDRVVWTAKCNANVCGGWVMSSLIGTPNAAPVWSTTANTNMRGVAVRSGTIGFAFGSSQGAFFARLPPGSSVPLDYPGDADIVSPLRSDGDFFVFLMRSGNDVTLARIRADGTAPPAPLASSTGSRGGVVPDGPAIYWISQEEGVLRAIVR